MRRSSLYCGTKVSWSFASGASNSYRLFCIEINNAGCRYASDLTPDQKDALLDVVRANPHPQMGLEVRRELVNSIARGELRADADGDVEMA